MAINKTVSIGIIFTITLISVLLFALPKYQESVILQDSLNLKQEEYVGRSQYYVTVSDFVDKIEKNNVSLEKITSALPDDFYLSSLVYFLQKKSSDAGLITKLVLFSKIAAPTSEKPLRTATFVVNVAGNYQGLKNFLNSIETSSRLFEVNSITFNSDNGAKNPSALQQPSQLSGSKDLYNFNLELETNAY